MAAPDDAVGAASSRKIGDVVKCGTCGTDREIIDIKKVSDGKQITLACGHTFADRHMVVTENLDITENFDWVILKDPVAEIKRAISNADYFKTVTYACSVFEYCGQEILIWDSNMKKDKQDPLNPEEVSKWSLHRIIEQLFRCKIITDLDAAKLHCIRGLRNEFVHKDYSIKLTSKVAQKISAHHDDIINSTAKLKGIYDELAAKGEAGAAVTD